MVKYRHGRYIKNLHSLTRSSVTCKTQVGGFENKHKWNKDG